MPFYQYVAVNQSGAEIHATVEASSREDAYSKVEETGYKITKITGITNSSSKTNSTRTEEEAGVEAADNLQELNNNEQQSESSVTGGIPLQTFTHSQLSSSNSGNFSDEVNGIDSNNPGGTQPNNNGNYPTVGSGDFLSKILDELRKQNEKLEKQVTVSEKATQYEQAMRKFEENRDSREYWASIGETIKEAIEGLTPMGGSGKNIGDLFSNVAEIGTGAINQMREVNRVRQPRRSDYDERGNLKSKLPKPKTPRRTQNTPKNRTQNISPSSRNNTPSNNTEPGTATSGGIPPTAPPTGSTTTGAGAESELTEAAVAGEAIPGVDIAATLVLFTVAIAELTKAAYAFAYAQEKEVRKLAEVGGGQANAIAELDAARIGRQISTAGDTEQSSVELVAALNNLEEALRPFEALFTNLANFLGTAIAKDLTSVITVLNLLFPVLDGLYRFFTNKKEDDFTSVNVNKWDMLDKIKEENEKYRSAKWPTGS